MFFDESLPSSQKKFWLKEKQIEKDKLRGWIWKGGSSVNIGIAMSFDWLRKRVSVIVQHSKGGTDNT